MNNQFLNNILVMLIKSPVMRARILAAIRAGLVLGGTWLASKGYLSVDSMNTDVGAIMIAIGTIWGQTDVTKVDKQMDAALSLAPQLPSDTIKALKDGTF